MDLNKLALESLENAKRRTGKEKFEPYEWGMKAEEELWEWSNSDLTKKSTHCPTLTEDEEETADIILVMLSYAASKGYDIEKAIRTKHRYNLKRND